MRERNWAIQSRKEILHELGTTEARGLSIAEVAKRQEVYGKNILAQEKKLSGFAIFFNQFKSALIYILLIAATVSFVLGHHTDAWVIVAAVIVNVSVGFFQEFRAERALEALQKIVTFTATAIREGAERALDPVDLVPGDIVKLRAGSKVPADIRLLVCDRLQINEAPLTGESLPVAKKAERLESAVVVSEKTNIAFFGTTVVGGTGLGVVVATGQQTEIGRIAELLSETDREETPLQAKLRHFSKTILIIILSFSAILFAVGLALGNDFVQMFTTAIALAVAAIPEGLVVVMTVILALGMKRILDQHALVRKLVAAETLGSTNVICTDKTGTLTEGEMHVVRILTDEHDVNIQHHNGTDTHPESAHKALLYGLLGSDAYLENPKDALHAWKIFGDPTERALVAAAAKSGLLRENEQKRFPRKDVLPFNSERKFMVTLQQGKQEDFIIAKGAPEILLRHVKHIDRDNHIHSASEEEIRKLERQHQRLSSEGLRILAIGYKPYAQDTLGDSEDILDNLVFLGFFCLQDPVRDDVKETIALTRQSGIRVVMLTGDHKLTAQAIAKEIGLPAESKNIIDGPSLEHLSKEELDKRITNLDVYARVSPKDKLRIIDAWQRKGYVVAMTGDGVNDAPALKSADIGIALGSGTDVAKETAEMILLKNNFSVIVAAIEQGRVIFSNIKKVILYLMSDSFTEMILISMGLFLGLPLPLLASQILWVNLVSDGLPALALTFEHKETDVMKEAPIPRNEPIFTKHMLQSIVVISLLTGFLALVIFYTFWSVTGDLDRARTVTFMAVTVDSLLYVLSVRVIRRPIWKQSLKDNPLLAIALAVAFLVLLVALYVPAVSAVLSLKAPGAIEWTVAIVHTLFHVAVFEFLKYWFRRQKTGMIL